MINNLLKLFRIKNLILIVIIQYLMRYCIIKPVLTKYDLNFLFSNFNFLILVFITVLLAAAGYLINDYFDAEHDKLTNKNNVIDNGISKKLAFKIYIIFNIIGISLGFYISFLIGMYKLGIFFILISGLLWFYSTSFKRSFLLGNLIVALIASLVPLIILPYEILLQYEINKSILLSTGNNLSEIIYWILGYSIFAFLITFIREIIKDIEDYDADIKFNYNTLPIVAGIKISKIIVSVFSVIVISLLFFIINKYLNLNIFQFMYLMLLIILPLFNIGILTLFAKTQKHFHLLSLLTKATMLTGVLFSILASFTF